MNEKISVRVDDGKELKNTRALEHPLITLRNHARKEYEEGRTVELRKFARREEISNK